MIATLLIITAICCFLLGSVVITQNPKKLTNQLFTAICLCFVIWAVSILAFFASSTKETALLSSKSFYIIAAIFPCLLLIFASIFPRDDKTSLATKLLVILLGVVMSLSIALSPDFVIGHIILDPVRGNRIDVEKISYLIYSFYFVSIFAAGIYIAFKKFFENRGNTKMQAGLYALGILINSVPGVVTNLILPYFSIYDFIWVGPVASVFFLGFATYSIIRHSLFDIRLAAVRSVAYGLALISLSVIYYFLAYIVSTTLFQGQVSSRVSISPINIALALVLAFLFQPIKNFFDKITNDIFYRDRYNSDDFFARFNEVLSTTTDLRGLLQHSAMEIAATLKASQAFFYVQYNHVHHVSSGTDHHSSIPVRDAHYLNEYVEQSGSDIIVANLLAEDDPIYRMLVSHKVAVLMPLMRKDVVVGYLALGEQLSGGYTTRDIKVLNTISDELVIAIQNALSVQEVKDVNIHLQQRIDAATKELRASNAQLRHLDTTKDEFLSMASHQLRTPLTSVKGYISMVLEGDAGKVSDMQKHLLSEAFVSSERMVHLIHDFLNVSRLQTGKFMLETRPIDLVKLVDAEVSSLVRTAEARNMKLKFTHSGDMPVLNIDENKIQQVVMNYIDNAIFYSHEQTTIMVSLRRDGDMAELRVHDTGIGVPKHEQAQLFTKFYRASNARKQRPDGTGVGLYLAKKVVTAHGGEVLFESQEGKGSTFGFRLPISKLEVTSSAE